uniref:Enoyl reductase (ER) domain-containing protein n=1 Tax=Erythrolobus australicus TaxID=1077150 RepID=A0A7S1TNA6_9RHOD|mmetsp:Transcript_4898/g.13148  ORF Transcript_4898/g.13148 Transcript_4898/m.13148 type:complete len:334 (+) Transcript_4898:31-1032(+)
MKAVGQAEYGGAEVLKIVEVPAPEAGELDVVVRNKAAGVNPVDWKVRAGGVPLKKPSEEDPLVIGWDAAGVVEKVGDKVKDLKVGDEVFYSGDVTRAGSYAELTAVDSRIVAKKPKNLSFAEAATIPLVAITAAETLIDAFDAKKGQSILLYNGAGGMGSFTIQLAKAMGLTVIATASRPETTAFVKDLGADHVINHREPLAPQLEAAGVPQVNYVFDLYDNKNLVELISVLKPGGRAAIVWTLEKELVEKLDWYSMWSKRQSIMSVFMFSRPMFGYELERQGELLTHVAGLIDEGKIKAVVNYSFTLEEISKAHELQESGKVMGKIGISITE